MFINIKNVKIYYEVINENLLDKKTPVIFLHEGLGSVAQWGDFPEKLCKKLNLPAILYDRQGHGKSAELTEPRKITFLYEQADFLHNFLHKLSVKKPVILFGHSDGATIALLYASEYQQDTLTVISEAHHIFIEKISVEGVKKAIDAFENNSRFREGLARFHGDKTEQMFYAWANVWTSDAAKSLDFTDDIKKITCPILAIQGTDDNYGSEAQLTVLKKNCRTAETHLLQDCGHIPHREQPEKVIEITTNFIENSYIPILR